MSRPATEVFTWCETPSVDACARWALPKASFTKMVAPESAMSRAAKPGSLASSSLWKRTFSSISACPLARAADACCTSGPMQSVAIATAWPSSSPRRAATGFKLSSGAGPFLGRPRCEARTRRAPPCRKRERVGSDARMRVSSVMTPFSMGTL